jgi:hypothetical protein
MSAGAFSDLSAELCAWGQWGAGDVRGALNYIRPDHVGRPAGLVTSGRTVGLGLPLHTSTGPDSNLDDLARACAGRATAAI